MDFENTVSVRDNSKISIRIEDAQSCIDTKGKEICAIDQNKNITEIEDEKMYSSNEEEKFEQRCHSTFQWPSAGIRYI